MRDNNWLQEELNFLLSKYFSSVSLTNPIEVKFGREAKYRFGSIKLVEDGPRRRRSVLSFPTAKTPKKSIITITSMFKDEKIPVGVVRYTLCHELCHYAHGFSSMNKKMFRFPHHGGVINKELKERGAEELIPIFKAWLKEYRQSILDSRPKVRRRFRPIWYRRRIRF